MLMLLFAMPFDAIISLRHDIYFAAHEIDAMRCRCRYAAFASFRRLPRRCCCCREIASHDIIFRFRR